MKLGTRLLLPLVAAVALVMLGFAAWALQQRERMLSTEAQRETRAYATALGLALEAAFEDDAPARVQRIIDEISRQPSIYGVLVYDSTGSVVYASDPLPAAGGAPDSVVRAVIRTARPATIERELDQREVFSVVRPVGRGPSATAEAAFEVAQPLSFVQEEVRSTRLRFLLNTLALVVAVSGLILLLVNRMVARPLDSLVLGAQALGRGEMGHRIPPSHGAAELDEVAREFNRMAERLQEARREVLDRARRELDLERHLRESERLAATGTLAAGLAHQMGAPLQVIRGRTEMLLSRDRDHDERLRNLRIVKDQTERITAIVRNLMAYCRRREIVPQPIEVGRFLDGVLELLETEFDTHGIEVRRTGAEALEVLGDANQLHEVLMNMLVNSCQALADWPGERAITLHVQRSDSGSLPGLGQAEAVVIEVRDTGPGVPEELADRVFDPFTTSRSDRGGTGLGLAVASGIVREHGGRLELAPADGEGRRSGRGAVFRLTLPGVAGE